MKVLIRSRGLGMLCAHLYLALLNPLPTRRFIGGLEHARMGDRTDTHVWFYPFRVYVSQ